MPQLLKALVDQGGSDLHLTSESAPRLRIDGQLISLDVPPLTMENCKTLCYSVLTEEQRKIYEQNKEIDLVFSVKALARFRANIFRQRGKTVGVFRRIANQAIPIKDLGLPPVIYDICHQPKGLVLVTGPTGSGKSTTLTSIIDYVNHTFYSHIVTIEDPVEFIFENDKCIISQREVGQDTHTFGKALKSALRQDPDIVVVGELRDLEAISLAVTTAETGHLVFATLHTNSSVSTLTRMIDVFPAEQQGQIRLQIAANLQGILSQNLHPMPKGGRCMSMEVLVPNPAIRNLIRENKIHQIYSSMQSGRLESGMITMNESLLNLVRQRKISAEYALSKSDHPDEFRKLLAGR